MEIKDSGERSEFQTGAVRDIQSGKGRFDLMPLGVLGAIIDDRAFALMGKYQKTGDVKFLYELVACHIKHLKYIYMAELSKHFEAGAKKYGEYNWQKGIPRERYIDSAMRHYVKGRLGCNDEPHWRAFLWNVVCLIWSEENIYTATDRLKDES